MTQQPKRPEPTLTSTAFDVAELNNYYRNPRRGNIDAIARSLEVNGQYRTIVVNLGSKTGRPLEVLAGNHTLAAARKLGWHTIDATTVDVDDIAAARIVAADNKTADLGGYDDDMLAGLLNDLPDLDGTGYSDLDLKKLLDDADADPVDSGATDTYTQRWEIVVECDDEQQQEKLYGTFTEEGLTCRLLSL